MKSVPPRSPSILRPHAVAALAATLWAGAGSCGPSSHVERWLDPPPAQGREVAPPAGPPNFPPPPPEPLEPDTRREPLDAGAWLAPDGAAEAALADAGDPGFEPAPRDAGPAPDRTSSADLALDASDASDPAPPPSSAAAPTITSEPARALTDLSAQGTLDWIHWGHDGAASITRKRGVPLRIGAAPVGTGRVGRYDDRPVGFIWSDGFPTLAARTRAGAATGGQIGAGFRVWVEGPIDRSLLTLHVGAWNAQAELRVRRGPGAPPIDGASEGDVAGQPPPGAPDRRFTAGSPGRDRVATVAVAPVPAGHSLIVEWTVGAVTHPAGNVTLQGATLSPLPEPGAGAGGVSAP